MTNKREYHKVSHKTIRPPEQLYSLLKAKAASEGNTTHRLMINELWKSVEGLVEVELDGDPSLEVLQKHLAAALLRAEQEQQYAIELNERIMKKQSKATKRKKS